MTVYTCRAEPTWSRFATAGIASATCGRVSDVCRSKTRSAAAPGRSRPIRSPKPVVTPPATVAIARTSSGASIAPSKPGCRCRLAHKRISTNGSSSPPSVELSPPSATRTPRSPHPQDGGDAALQPQVRARIVTDCLPHGPRNRPGRHPRSIRRAPRRRWAPAHRAHRVPPPTTARTSDARQPTDREFPARACAPPPPSSSASRRQRCSSSKVTHCGATGPWRIRMLGVPFPLS